MAEEKPKHIRNYGKVLKMIEAFFAAREKEDRDRLAECKALLNRVRAGEKNVTYKSGDLCTESGLATDVNRFEAYLAPPWRGKPRKDTLLAWKASMLKRLEAADRAPVFAGLKVKIDWHRSRTWGNCPSAEAWVFGTGDPIYTTKGSDGRPVLDHRGEPFLHTTHYATGRASGCGYDKRSAAAGEAISCPTIDRLIIEHEKAWECYAVDGTDNLPHLSIGGKGVETLRALFHAYGGKAPIPGFEWTWEEGRTWDFIEVAPKARKGRD